MAKDYSYAGYEKSGFPSASGVKSLQEQLAAHYQRSNEQLRADAEATYANEYAGKKLTYQNQLDQLGIYRNADIKKVNASYDRQGSVIQRDLTGRGLGRSSLVSTRGVENENARNAAVADKSLEYLQQENEINANLQQLDADYAQNVENKFTELRDKQNSDYISLLAKIAELQQAGYSSWINYQLNK